MITFLGGVMMIVGLIVMILAPLFAIFQFELYRWVMDRFFYYNVSVTSFDMRGVYIIGSLLFVIGSVFVLFTKL